VVESVDEIREMRGELEALATGGGDGAEESP
jgi:hypothetical protein